MQLNLCKKIVISLSLPVLFYQNINMGINRIEEVNAEKKKKKKEKENKKYKN